MYMQLLIRGNSVGLLFIQQDGKYVCMYLTNDHSVAGSTNLGGYILQASLGANNFEWAYLLYWSGHNSCLMFTRLNQEFREMVRLCICVPYISQGLQQWLNKCPYPGYKFVIWVIDYQSIIIMGDQLLPFSQLIGRSCDHYFTPSFDKNL